MADAELIKISHALADLKSFQISFNESQLDLIELAQSSGETNVFSNDTHIEARKAFAQRLSEMSIDNQKGTILELDKTIKSLRDQLGLLNEDEQITDPSLRPFETQNLIKPTERLEVKQIIREESVNNSIINHYDIDTINYSVAKESQANINQQIEPQHNSSYTTVLNKPVYSTSLQTITHKKDSINKDQGSLFQTSKNDTNDDDDEWAMF